MAKGDININITNRVMGGGSVSPNAHNSTAQYDIWHHKYMQGQINSMNKSENLYLLPSARYHNNLHKCMPQCACA